MGKLLGWKQTLAENIKSQEHWQNIGKTFNKTLAYIAKHCKTLQNIAKHCKTFNIVGNKQDTHKRKKRKEKKRKENRAATAKV